MSANHKTWLTSILAALLAAGVCSRIKYSHADAWEVLIGALPDKIYSKNASETPTFYILKQTHEPVFRQDDGQNYSSRVLKSWKRNARSTEYLFCPDVSLKFDSQNVFSSRFFLSYLSAITRKYDAGSQITAQKDCAVVNFPRPKPGYLDYLAHYENAPSINPTGTIEEGLGPFYVESIGKEEVILNRKIHVYRGYNKIVFHEYAGEDDPQLKNRNIADFNKLSFFQQPNWIHSEYRSFDNVEMRVTGLAINSADKKLREALYNCIDMDAFRGAFVPERKTFLDIKRVLPVGIPGGRAGRITQVCSAAQKTYLKDKEITLANPYKTNRVQLAGFSANVHKENGPKLIVKNYEPRDLLKELYDRSKKKSYNLIVIISDTVRPEYPPFFEYYLGQDSGLDYVPERLRKLYKKMLYEDDRVLKSNIADELADGIEKEALVLPLYQTSVKMFYPRKIKNLEVGVGFSEFPDVADLRW